MAKVEIKKKEPKSFHLNVPLTDGVKAELDGKILKVAGPKGEVSKMLKYPKISVQVKDSDIIVGTDDLGRREKKMIFTFYAHIKNLVKGVTEGFEYDLRVVFAKFPITVEMKGDEFLVKNLLGEKVPRVVKIPKDVKIELDGKEIKVSGINKETVGQAAASIEQLCRVTNLDRRVVQDGIYIIKKPHRVYSA